MTAQDLIDFEAHIVGAIEGGRTMGPVHLSGGNEEQLIEIFKGIDREDWVFSTWRCHYHALLHGVNPESLLTEILDGRSMNFMSPEHRFFTSAIVGGCLPIAVGVAAALKRAGFSTRKVWCFIGDMAATTGAFHEAHAYAFLNDLPVTFVVEDNGLSTNSPTLECWGQPWAGFGDWFNCNDVFSDKVIRYSYKRTYPHYGVTKEGF